MCVCMHTSLYSYIKSKMVCQCSSISVISLLFQISSFHLHFVHYFQPLLFWNFWKALQRRIFLRFLLFRVSVSKTEATVTVLTEQLSLEMHLFGFVHAAEIPPGMLCSTCHALDISNLTWKRNPVWFHQNQWQLTPKKFTLQLILQPFPSFYALLWLCSHSTSLVKEQPFLYLDFWIVSKHPSSSVCHQRLRASKIGQYKLSFEVQWVAYVPLLCFTLGRAGRASWGWLAVCWLWTLPYGGTQAVILALDCRSCISLATPPAVNHLWQHPSRYSCLCNCDWLLALPQRPEMWLLSLITPWGPLAKGTLLLLVYTVNSVPLSTCARKPVQCNW